MTSPVTILIEAPQWRVQDLRGPLSRAARLALKHGRKEETGSLTILLADDATLRRLNREFRGLDKPTNVLSFPAPANLEGHLGDIAVAFETAAREAREAGIGFADHVTHLAVHGVLHLLGYDHADEAGAAVMEPLEIAILARLGIADPYAARAAKVA